MHQRFFIATTIGSSSNLHTTNKPRQLTVADNPEEVLQYFQYMLPGTKIVHGKACHSESQGFVENRNKVALYQLTKWCLQNTTAYYWLGIPSMGYHLNARINHRNKNAFEYLYGIKPVAGISSHPLEKRLLRHYQWRKS